MNAVPKMDRALDDLRYYLRAWRAWTRAWRAPLNYSSCVPWLRVMPPTPAWEAQDDDHQVDAYILRAISAEVESLPALKRAAVRLVYMNEVLPAVFRSGRMKRDEVFRLCDEAELEMIPKLRVRGVVLGSA